MPYSINDKMAVNADNPGISYMQLSIINLAQDLSGSLQGAGGIGGLVSVTRNTSSSTEIFYPVCDANGNISDYVDASGNVVAHREYDAYGNTITSSGSVNDFNFWFSSKYYDSEINAYYFGYRYYSPALSRWLNRDPIGERGGINLYGFLENSTIISYDPIGLTCESERNAVLAAKNRLDAVESLASTGVTSSELFDRIREMESDSAPIARHLLLVRAELSLLEGRRRVASRSGVLPSDPAMVENMRLQRELSGVIWGLRTDLAVRSRQVAVIRDIYRTAASLPAALANARSEYEATMRTWRGCMDREREASFSRDKYCTFAECIGIREHVESFLVERTVHANLTEAATRGFMSIESARGISRAISRTTTPGLIAIITTCFLLSF